MNSVANMFQSLWDGLNVTLGPEYLTQEKLCESFGAIWESDLMPWLQKKYLKGRLYFPGHSILHLLSIILSWSVCLCTQTFSYFSGFLLFFRVWYMLMLPHRSGSFCVLYDLTYSSVYKIFYPLISYLSVENMTFLLYLGCSFKCCPYS